MRKAFAAERAAIAKTPQDAANYVDLAYTELDAGMGQQARETVAEATRLAPSNALAFGAQAFILHSSLIGVNYGHGFDYDGSLHAQQTAIALNPGDLEARLSLANLLEFNREGVRYAPDANLDLAIEAYRYVKQHQGILRSDVVDNLAIDLFYAGRYKEALQEVANLPGTLEHLGVSLASTAALKGSSVAIEVSKAIQGDEQRRKDALNFAAEGLWNKRLYPQAADLLTASLPDSVHGANVAAKIQLFKNLKPFVPANLPTTDPRRPVELLLEGALMGMQVSETEVVSRHSGDIESARNIGMKSLEQLTSRISVLMKQTGLPRAVVVDLLFSQVALTSGPVQNDSATVRVQVAGRSPGQYFVVREGDTWKIAASSAAGEQVAAQAWYLLQQDRSAEATSLLNWYYSVLAPSGDASDALSGNLFAKLWSPSARESTGAAQQAVAALSQDKQVLQAVLPAIQAEHDAAIGRRKETLELLLATVYFRLQDASAAQAVAVGLLKANPDSMTALHLAGQAYALNKLWPEWKRLLATRRQVDPNSRAFLLEVAAEAEQEKDFGNARSAYRDLMQSPHAAALDGTMYAWLSLFAGKADAAALAAAQQAAVTPESRSYAALLALACLHASTGKTAEAHQELLDAMTDAHLPDPDAAIWYGFGLIFEQYGEMEAARSAYRNSVRMAATREIGSLEPSAESAALLAKTRLLALEKPLPR